VEVRYYFDPDPRQPHIYGHGLTEAELEWILAHPAEDGPCSESSRQALGQTAAGRYLRVVYAPKRKAKACLWSRHSRSPESS
jgi:hypothetical protein